MPKVTNVQPCTMYPNWHDIAGALFYDGVYHVFQGSNACRGQQVTPFTCTPKLGYLL